MASTSSASKRPNLDSVTTINEDGSRYILHPADVRGRFSRWRRLFALLLLVVYVVLPWIPVNGKPAVFLDLAERRFHLFGITFLAQDAWLAFFVITGLGFGLFFVTALFGRLWCGWACPYTVFLEHVFRRIERWIDGDAQARRRLDRAPWTGGKIRKRILKHGLFLLVAAAIAHVFLSYFVSLPRLYEYMGQSPLEHLPAFGVVVFLTGVLYFCFSWFREQFCIILCPYGRIQSALTDDDTLVIGYDEQRGEPRGKATNPDAGDCIDCSRCVQVCPTGIDIRDGLQIECIGCAACVDACDAVMTRLGRPEGLIRYDSYNGLAGRVRRFIRPRIFLYTALLGVGAAVMAVSLTKVKPFFVMVTRMQGNPYYVTDAGVRNQFQLRVINKRNQPVTYTVALDGIPEEAVTTGFETPLDLEARGEQVRPFTLTVPRDAYTGTFDVSVRVESGIGGAQLARTVRFLGPDARLLRGEDEAPAPTDPPPASTDPPGATDPP